jgi:HEAT repeat protein
MLNYDNYAVTLGRAVGLMRRGPESVPEQKVALRALAALARLGGVTVRATDGQLWIEQTAVSSGLPGVATLLNQMEGHAVAEIRIRHGAGPAALLDLLRALAVPIGRFPLGKDLAAHLRAETAPDVTVQLIHRITDRPAATPLPSSEADGATTSRFMRDDTHHRSPAEAAVATIAVDPMIAEIDSYLELVAAHVRAELEQGHPSGAVRAVAQLIQLEASAASPEEQAILRNAVASLLIPELFHGAVDCTNSDGAREAAIAVLRRGGAPASTVLRERLFGAETPEERQHCLELLRVQPEGLRSLILLVQHPTPTVVCQTAAVLGGLGIHEAVPALARVARHHDPTVRDTVITAVARLASPNAIEVLGQLLEDRNPDVRGSVARAVTGPIAAPLTGALDRAGRREGNRAAVTDFGRALGRIGTPEAVWVLAQWAEHPGWRIWRRHRGVRMAAVEGLRLVGGSGAAGILEGLLQDRDRAVRLAATEALESLSIAEPGRSP